MPFEKLKKRSGIRNVARQGEAASANQEAAEEFVQEFSNCIKQGQAIFLERGPDKTFGSSLWARVTNVNPKMTIYKNFIEKKYKSMRWLVLLAMKKCFNAINYTFFE